MTDDEGPDNEDRADRVSGYVNDSFARYWGGEYVETVVQDLISDLLHYLDRADEYIAHIDHIHRDPDRVAFWRELLEHAADMYEQEVSEEETDREEREREEQDAAASTS